jgi:hypothetical protein
MASDDLARQAFEYYRDGLLLNSRATFIDLVRNYRFYRSWWVLSALNSYGGFEMARGKRKGVPTSPSNNSWNTQFVDIPLTGVTMDEIVATFPKEEMVFDSLADLLEDGYRVGFAYNAQNDAVICSITCKDAQSVNAGMTFTAFAGNWYDALRVGLYKHYVVAEQVWAGEGGKAKRPSFG